MALTGEELRRRIVSGAALHGWGLRELRNHLEKYGANRHMAERMISGQVPQTRANLDALSAVLELPVEWFEADDWRVLVSAPSESGEAGQPATRLDLAAMREELLSDLARELAARDAQQTRQVPAGSPGEVSGG